MWNKGDQPVVTVDLSRAATCAPFRIQAGAYPWWDAMQGVVRDAVEVQTSTDGRDFTSQGHFDRSDISQYNPPRPMQPNEPSDK